MSKTAALVLVIAFAAAPLVGAGFAMSIAFNKRIPPHEKIRRGLRVIFVFLAIAWVLAFFIVPRHWWFAIMLVFIIGCGWIWLVGRGGHKLVDARRVLPKYDNSSMSAIDDNENGTEA